MVDGEAAAFTEMEDSCRRLMPGDISESGFPKARYEFPLMIIPASCNNRDILAYRTWRFFDDRLVTGWQAKGTTSE